MPVLLRDFLYLDERLMSNYLAQLEGGTCDEEAHSHTAARDRSGAVSGNLGAVGGQLGRSSSGEQTTTRTVRQTPEAAYRRLEALLDEQDGVQWLEAFDDAIWRQLRRGELLAVESRTEVPSIYQATEMAAGVAPLMGVMRSVGETISDEDEQVIEGMTQLGQMLKEVVVVAHAAGAPKYKFICSLVRDAMRQDVASLSGNDAVVVGSIQRILKSGERHSLLDTLGIGGMPRAERRQMERELKKDLPDSVVTAPAAVLTPLAIYR